ncbi:MAG: hypothetical protein QOD51_221 [Candidatus Eremiobacteraeota bacterium]|nr:hypothetical protein [Candidatus Eremiobacteraeota bacterium]
MRYHWSMPKKSGTRQRLQIELRPAEERLVARLRTTFGDNESEAGRRLLMLFDRLADLVANGAVLTALPAADERAIDAAPELTAAFRPELRYRFLVRVPHRWRKQLMIKGRRITVGNLVTAMQANELDVETAAYEYDLPVEAVREALDHYESDRELIESELAEERRRAEAVSVKPFAPAAG